MVLHRFEALWKEKVLRQLVDSIQLNTMATSYNLHFVNYSLGKKHVIQLIPTLMWKQVYIDYQTIYHDSYLMEKNFKDWLWNILKELKIGISNQEGLEKTTLQCDQVLKCLKATNGHVTKNILKRHQSLIDEAFILILETLGSS